MAGFNGGFVHTSPYESWDVQQTVVIGDFRMMWVSESQSVKETLDDSRKKQMDKLIS